MKKKNDFSVTEADNQLEIFCPFMSHCWSVNQLRTSLKAGTEEKRTRKGQKANGINLSIKGINTVVLESDIDKISDANAEGFILKDQFKRKY